MDILRTLLAAARFLPMHRAESFGVYHAGNPGEGRQRAGLPREEVERRFLFGIAAAGFSISAILQLPLG